MFVLMGKVDDELEEGIEDDGEELDELVDVEFVGRVELDDLDFVFDEDDEEYMDMDI